MKFKIQVDGKEYDITAAADGTVIIGGEPFDTRTTGVNSDKRTISVGERNYEVRVVENTTEAGCFTLEVNGERVPLTVSDLVRERASAVTETRGASAEAASLNSQQVPTEPGGAAGEAKDGLFAPVPGKIMDVFVNVGDLVEEGTPLVVLEAMKMENELRAPKKGKVTQVAVQKGDTAQRGQLLVAIA